MRSSILVIVTTGVVAILSCRPAGNQSADIRIAVGGRAALDFVPIYVANSLGFFREAGLHLIIQDFSGTSKAVESLLGRSSELVAGGYDAAISMAAAGKRLQAVAVIERWPPLVILASNSNKRIQTIRDLKGATVGVSAPGSSTHQFLNYLLHRHGLTSSDVIPIGVGVNFSMAAAVERGHVQAAVAGPLGRALLEKNGNLTTIVDCRTAAGAREALGTDNLPFIAVIAQSEWAHRNPELLYKFGNAIRRALSWVHEHPTEQVMGAIPDEYKGKDRTTYLRALTEILPAFSREGLMPEDGPLHMREFVAASNPQLDKSEIRLEDTYTNSYIQIH